MANLLGLCGCCHTWAHSRVSQAREIGWIVPSWADPHTMPARLRDGVWWLRVDGSREAVDDGAFPLSNVPRDITRDGEVSS